MLGKVFKYDFKALQKTLFSIYSAALGLGILAKLFILLGEKISFFQLIAMPIQVLFYMVLIGSFFTTFAMSLIRYYKNIFKDEGYLTNTLPVSKNTILFSKLLVAIVYLFINILVALASLWIVLGNLAPFWNSIVLGLEGMLINPILLVSALGLLLLSAYMNYILIGFTALAIGHSFYKDKIPYSIVAAIICYIVLEIVMLLGMVPILLLHPEIFANMNMVPSGDFILQILLIPVVVGIIMNTAYYLVTKHVLNHKFNID